MSSRIFGAVRGIAWLAIITGIIGGCVVGYHIWDPMAGTGRRRSRGSRPIATSRRRYRQEHPQRVGLRRGVHAGE